MNLSKLYLALILLVLGCIFFNYERENANDSKLAINLYKGFDRSHPGQGVIDYPSYDSRDIPKSYAMILLAETRRLEYSYLDNLPNLAYTSGKWLLDNKNLDGDDIIGWGLPVAWDAYGDGTTNPENTEYTISTAIVVDALLTWMEIDLSSPKEDIMKTVTMALKPFADGIFQSPSGLIPYSFESYDLIYDTYNPAAYLAGQLQRFSLLTEDSFFASMLQDVADKQVQILLSNKLVNSSTGSWYWNYSIQQNVSNDLPHASYIIEGLLNYKLYKGRLSNRIDNKAVVNHLREFYDRKNGYVRSWPKLQTDIELPARTYDLGIALSLSCSLSQIEDLVYEFRDELPKYSDGKNGFLKYPKESDISEPLIVNEYQAYLYKGIVYCANKIENYDILAD